MASINLKTRSGNRIQAEFDGKQIGLIQSVRMSDSFGHEPASGVGDLHVIEYVPTMATHTIQVGTMVMNKNNLRAAGIAAENGDEVLEGKVIDIVAYSKDDGTQLRKYVGCSYVSGDVAIDKHAIVIKNAQFNALDVVGLGV